MIGRHRKFGVLGVLLATGAVLTAFSGCNHCNSPEKRAEWVTQKIAGKLDLTPEQEKKLEAVKTAFLDARKAHTADRKNTHDEIKRMILSDKLDTAEIKNLMSKKHATLESGLDSVGPKLAEFHASLSADQKKRAVELLEKFASHFERE